MITASLSVFGNEVLSGLYLFFACATGGVSTVLTSMYYHWAKCFQIQQIIDIDTVTERIILFLLRGIFIIEHLLNRLRPALKQL